MRRRTHPRVRSSLSGTDTRTATEGVEIGADITAYSKFSGDIAPGNHMVGNAASEAVTPTVTLSYGSGGALASAAVGIGGTSITFRNFVGMAPHIDARNCANGCLLFAQPDLPVWLLTTKP